MLVVVGGHSRNLGKTSVTAGLIRKLRDRQWTALKITQYGNSVCDDHAGACSEAASDRIPVAAAPAAGALSSPSRASIWRHVRYAT